MLQVDRGLAEELEIERRLVHRKIDDLPAVDRHLDEVERDIDGPAAGRITGLDGADLADAPGIDPAAAVHHEERPLPGPLHLRGVADDARQQGVSVDELVVAGAVLDVVGEARGEQGRLGGVGIDRAEHPGARVGHAAGNGEMQFGQQPVEGGAGQVFVDLQRPVALPLPRQSDIAALLPAGDVEGHVADDVESRRQAVGRAGEAPGHAERADLQRQIPRGVVGDGLGEEPPDRRGAVQREAGALERARDAGDMTAVEQEVRAKAGAAQLDLERVFRSPGQQVPVADDVVVGIRDAVGGAVAPHERADVDVEGALVRHVLDADHGVGKRDAVVGGVPRAEVECVGGAARPPQREAGGAGARADAQRGAAAVREGQRARFTGLELARRNGDGDGHDRGNAVVGQGLARILDDEVGQAEGGIGVAGEVDAGEWQRRHGHPGEDDGKEAVGVHGHPQCAILHGDGAAVPFGIGERGGEARRRGDGRRQPRAGDGQGGRREVEPEVARAPGGQAAAQNQLKPAAGGQQLEAEANLVVGDAVTLPGLRQEGVENRPVDRPPAVEFGGIGPDRVVADTEPRVDHADRRDVAVVAEVLPEIARAGDGRGRTQETGQQRDGLTAQVFHRLSFTAGSR